MMSWKHKIISRVAKILGIKVYFENPIHHSENIPQLEIIRNSYHLIKHKVQVQINDHVQHYIEYYPHARKETVIKIICQELAKYLNQLTEYDFDERMKVNENDYSYGEKKQHRYKFEFYTKQRDE